VGARGLLSRAWAALVVVDERVRALITLAHAVCADETPIRVGPERKKKYLLVACTALPGCTLADQDRRGVWMRPDPASA
jgi:hypothetical protein